MTTILITGVNRGIGLELVRQALEKGWAVCGSSRGAVPSDLTDHPAFTHLQFDVTDHGAVRDAAASVDGAIDIVVNNAGIFGPEDNATGLDDFDGFAQTLAVNTIAPLVVAQAFTPHLAKAAKGRILTISSSMGSLSYASSDHIAYRASKAAVNKVMQGLATDLARMGIAVAMIHPGWVQTDMGGPHADITVQESAGGILDIAENLDLTVTGQFINWDGSYALL